MIWLKNIWFFGVKAVKRGVMAAANVMFKKELTDIRKSIKDIPDPETLDILRKAEDAFFIEEYVKQFARTLREQMEGLNQC